MTGDCAKADCRRKTAALVAMFADNPAGALIGNLQTTLTSFDLAGSSFPVTVNAPAQTPNCYLCSPSTAYIDYARDETEKFDGQPAVKAMTKGLIQASAPLVRATGLDRHVQFNNWLLSTNPAPDLSSRDTIEMRDGLLSAHPDHAIIVRSVNEATDKATIDALRSAGFLLVPARQVYVLDTRTNPKPGRDVKRDRALLREASDRIVYGDSFTDADFERARTLYAKLYLEKYTPLNPQYSAAFLKLAQKSGLLTLAGVRGPGGHLEAFVAMFIHAGMLTAPMVGYDTARPQSAGLYRMALALAMEMATAQGLVFNMSAGAPGFKRNRGARPAIEYSAVYVRHLGWKNRAATRIAKSILTRIGVPLLKRFEL